MASRTARVLWGAVIALYLALSFVVSQAAATLAVLTDTSSASNVFSFAPIVQPTKTIYWALDGRGNLFVAPSAEEARQLVGTESLTAEGSFADKATPSWTSRRASIKTVKIARGLAPTTTYSWFGGNNNSCANLVEVDLSGMDGSYLTSMSMMFTYSSKLRRVTFGDLDTSHVTSLAHLFSNCSSLTELPDIGRIDTSRVKDLHSTFVDCTSLRELDLSGWNLSACTKMLTMFSNDTALERLVVGAGWRQLSSYTATFPGVMYGEKGESFKKGDSIPVPPEGADTYTYSSTRPLTTAASSARQLAAPVASAGSAPTGVEAQAGEGASVDDPPVADVGRQMPPEDTDAEADEDGETDASPEELPSEGEEVGEVPPSVTDR